MRMRSCTPPRGRGRVPGRRAAAGADVDGRLSYLRDSAGTFGWLAARAACQLGPEAYGQLVAAIAIGGFLAPVANLGLPGALVRDLSRQTTRDGSAGVRESVAMWLCVGPAAAAVGAMVVVLVLPGKLAAWAVAALAMAETVSASGAELLARIFQGRRRLMRFGQVMFSFPGARAAALGICAVLDVETLEAWVAAYALAGVLPAVWLVLAEPAAPGRAWRRWRELARRGRPFALSALAVRLQGELNKPLLAQLSHASAGQFGLAQRIMDIVLLPFVALMESLLPRVYACRRDPLAVLRGVGSAIALAALAIGAGLAAVGPTLLGFLGAGYTEAAWILVALAPFPAVHLTTVLGNVALIATGNADRMPQVVLGAAAAGTAAAAALIPWLGTQGAVVALYVGRLVALLLHAKAFRAIAKTGSGAQGGTRRAPR